MADQTDNTAEADGGEAKAKKSKKKLIMIGGALLVLLGAGGGAFMFMHKGEDKAKKEEPKKEAVFVDLPEMMVNLARTPQQDRSQYLKLKIALEVDSQKAAEEIRPVMPRIQDTFQVYMRELRPSDLDGSAGVYRLKEELLRRVNVAAYPAHVQAVLFKEVVVQ